MIFLKVTVLEPHIEWSRSEVMKTLKKKALSSSLATHLDKRNEMQRKASLMDRIFT